MKIKIFTNKSLGIDLVKFVDSRALLCANSGGGKSYAIRKLLEESHGKVMALVLDVEGEFKTLRERLDFLLVGSEKISDVTINMKSAHLLPRKLLELNVSTIIDISDFKRNERILYIKKFLESLMDLPRPFWKPCLVILDEAHLLAGQQEKQDSCGAVIDLMTRGRKRGYCGILCTQRIAKLHKDAVAETNNYMVGRTGLDIDMKRAAEILGFTSKTDMLSLRDLIPGEFYVFGPAVSRHVIKSRVDKVITTHPKVGMDLKAKIVQPTQKIKDMLSKLSDLPKEAEKELKTLQDMKKEIHNLRTEKRKLEFELKKKKPESDPKQLETSYSKGFNVGVRKSEVEWLKKLKQAKQSQLNYQKTINVLSKELQQFTTKWGKILQIKQSDIEIPKIQQPQQIIQQPKQVKPVVEPIIKPEQEPPTFEDSEVKPLKAGAMKMLNWLASFHPETLTKQRLATLSGFSMKGGTFNIYISGLKKNGWITGEDNLSVTEEGIENSQTISIPSKDELIEMWCKKFKAGVGKILRIVCEAYPDPVSKEEIATQTGFEISGGTFNTYVSTLNKNDLIIIEGEEIKASDELFE